MTEEKKSYPIRVGEKMREVLDMQKKQIQDATYNVVKASDYQAGEIIAKKMLKEI